jgi:hypothetical protein
MDSAQHVAARDLDEAFARVQLADCILEFRRQRATGDVWCIESGPLGTIAIPIIDRAGLDRVLAARTPEERRPWRGPKGVRIKLDDDFAIDLRLRGAEIVGTFLFADGSPFGGFGGGLPTRRKLAPRLRVLDWLRGRRGSGRIDYAVHRERP